MSYSRRQLYAMGEPLGDGATRREVGGKIIYGTGGGGGQPEKQTTVVDIPEWAKPYAKESLGKAAALTSTPYQAYGGERIAQFTPLQKQAFGRAEGQQVAGQVGLGSGLAAMSGISSFQDPGTAQGFMSPYMDAVVQQQMESAQRQADIAATQRGAQAVRAGAFGGSRQAIENAEAARALASQKGQIQATGLQSAFERGQSQFNAEQANRLAAAQALGQLGQQQFGQQMDITGQQAQFGGQQRQATQDILSQQYQDFLNQQRAPYDQLSFMSSLIRGTPMGQTTTMYSPPASTTSQLVGLGTAAAGAYGAYAGKAAGGEIKGYAAGGIASLNQPELAAMAGGMSDQQLGQTAQMPSITELAKMTLAAEAQQRAQMRQQAMMQQAMAQQQPQGTVAEEQMAALEQGIGGLDVPDDLVGDEGMAGGGIVAFDNGGYVPFYQRGHQQREEKGSIYDPYFGLPAAERERRRIEDAAKANELRSSQIAELQAGNRAAIVGSAQKEIDDLVANRDDLVRRFGQTQYDQKLQKLSQNLLSTEDRFTQRQQEQAQAAQQAAQVLEQARAKASPASGIAALADAKAPIPSGSAANRSALNASNQAAAVKADKLAVAGQGIGSGATPSGKAGATGAGGAAPSSGGLMGMLEKEQARRVAAQEEIDKLRAADVATARGELDAEEKRAREFGSERESRLKKQEEELGKEKSQSVFKTMIQTGLAIAAGRSPDALANIAQGAAAGLEGYEKRMATIRAGQEKLDENFARLAEIREEKSSAVGAERRRLLAEERNIKTNSKVAIEGIMSSVYDKKFSLKEKDVDRAFEMSKINAQNAAANARALMTDERADKRAQLSAAQDLMKSAQKVIADGIGDETEIAQAKKDYAAAAAVLRDASSGKTINFADI